MIVVTLWYGLSENLKKLLLPLLLSYLYFCIINVKSSNFTENIALMLSLPVGKRGIDEGGLLFMVELGPDQMSKLLIMVQIRYEWRKG